MVSRTKFYVRAVAGKFLDVVMKCAKYAQNFYGIGTPESSEGDFYCIDYRCISNNL